MVTSNRRHRVAIIGGGLGGLTAAAFLQREGIDVHVYEQAPKLEEVGAGINLDTNATRVLKLLGLDKELMKFAVPLDKVWEFRQWNNGHVLYSEPFDSDFGSPHVVIHRGDLQNVLKSAISEESISLGHRCINIEENNDGVEITFENGITVEADVLIGADGPHSVVRNAVANPTPKRFRGAIYRSLVPMELVPPSQRVPDRTAWLGKRNFFMRYPVSGGKLLNIAAGVSRSKWDHSSSTVEAKVDDFLAEFADWDEDVQVMIKACPNTKLWALYDMPQLDRWSSNRITLLGDAAHFMLPYLGQGAAQAMEDAVVLSGYLKDIKKGNHVSELLTRYERMRKPRASMVQMMASTIWDFIDTPGAEATVDNLPGGDIFNTYKGLFNMHEWLNGYKIEKDIIKFPEDSQYTEISSVK